MASSEGCIPLTGYVIIHTYILVTRGSEALWSWSPCMRKSTPRRPCFVHADHGHHLIRHTPMWRGRSNMPVANCRSRSIVPRVGTGWFAETCAGWYHSNASRNSESMLGLVTYRVASVGMQSWAPVLLRRLNQNAVKRATEAHVKVWAYCLIAPTTLQSR